MTTKRKVAHKDWHFDGSTITVRIPMIWKRQGGRKVIIAPDGGDAWAPAKPRQDETLMRALARAHRWRRMLKDGTYTSAAEIAEAEGVTRSFINRLLRLTLLAPDIQEAILEGRQPKGMQVEDLTRVTLGAWDEQRKHIMSIGCEETGFAHRASGQHGAYRNIPTVALSLNGDCRGRQPRGAVIQEPGSGAERAGRALDIRR